MNELTLALLMIAAFFFVFLGVKEFLSTRLKEKFCVICAAVFSTWIILLVLSWQGLFKNIILIALLAGMSVLGIYYRIEARLSKDARLLRLPLILSLVVAVYLLLFETKYALPSLIAIFLLIVLIWILFLLAFSCRNNPSFKRVIQKIVECCKRW